jgi:hypothetical protein
MLPQYQWHLCFQSILTDQCNPATQTSLVTQSDPAVQTTPAVQVVQNYRPVLADLACQLDPVIPLCLTIQSHLLHRYNLVLLWHQ